MLLPGGRTEASSSRRFMLTLFIMHIYTQLGLKRLGSLPARRVARNPSGDSNMTTNFVSAAFVIRIVVGSACIAGQTAALAQQDRFAGTWNYDQPGDSSGINIGTIHCPATPKRTPEFVLKVPQIGDLTIKRTNDGHLEGRTDQGCTWTFKADGSFLELDPVPQSCFNKVIGSSYTMTRWSVQTDGQHETEVIEAKSHLPIGDCEFVLKGTRTKADDTDSAALFVGAWEYDLPNPETHSNVLQIRQQGDNVPTSVPQTGTVSFAKTGDHTLTAHTPDGCSWLLDVHGNTALLRSPQTCEITGSKTTMNHWTTASDGEKQNSVISMTRDAGGKIRTALLAAGRLTKNATRSAADGSSQNVAH